MTDAMSSHELYEMRNLSQTVAKKPYMLLAAMLDGAYDIYVADYGVHGITLYSYVTGIRHARGWLSAYLGSLSGKLGEFDDEFSIGLFCRDGFYLCDYTGAEIDDDELEDVVDGAPY